MKNYVGNGWESPKFEGMINISLNLEKLKELPVNEYGDIKLTVSKMREPNVKSKATHTVYENDYNPAPQGGQTRKPYPTTDEVGSENLPF